MTIVQSLERRRARLEVGVVVDWGGGKDDRTRLPSAALCDVNGP